MECFIWRKSLTGGGLILHTPYFSATGRILLMKASGSRKSSSLGSKVGASGGTSKMNSSRDCCGFSGDRFVPWTLQPFFPKNALFGVIAPRFKNVPLQPKSTARQRCHLRLRFAWTIQVYQFYSDFIGNGFSNHSLTFHTTISK